MNTLCEYLGGDYEFSFVEGVPPDITGELIDNEHLLLFVYSGMIDCRIEEVVLKKVIDFIAYEYIIAEEQHSLDLWVLFAVLYDIEQSKELIFVDSSDRDQLTMSKLSAYIHTLIWDAEVAD